MMLLRSQSFRCPLVDCLTDHAAAGRIGASTRGRGKPLSRPAAAPGIIPSLPAQHRSANEVLRARVAQLDRVRPAQGSPTDDVVDQAGSQALTAGRRKKLKAFRKWPDSPLGEVVEQRLSRRKRKNG